MLNHAAEQLRAWRTGRRLSLADLAAKLECDPGHLSRIERALVSTISVDLAVAIQRLTGIPVESWRQEAAS